MQDHKPTLLRTALLIGAVTDALALLPMVFPFAAAIIWGGDGSTPASRIIVGYGAALMVGWTALLAWASRRPLERQFVAPLTMLVIAGLVVAEVAAVLAGEISAARMLPTWCLQTCLLLLFGAAYHYPAPRLERRDGVPR